MKRKNSSQRLRLKRIVVNLRKSLPTADNTRVDLLLEKRVASCGLTVSYEKASSPENIRTLAIYLNLDPQVRLASRRIACVRFMCPNELGSGGGVPDNEKIVAACSCSTNIGATYCEHAELLATSSFKIRDEISFILAYKSRRLLSETPNMCSALLIGERKRNAKDAWLVTRHNALNELTCNYEPVMESAAAKRAGQPIERRVTFKRWRLSPLQRSAMGRLPIVLRSTYNKSSIR